ncbi:hypothetical protein FOA52_010023 [Chlamydomonas sp. UWO 241]|nr:hypothetical protein FOA52_010023 [Chlamydomonas sp. UWO 241]
MDLLGGYGGSDDEEDASTSPQEAQVAAAQSKRPTAPQAPKLPAPSFGGLPPPDFNSAPGVGGIDAIGTAGFMTHKIGSPPTGTKRTLGAQAQGTGHSQGATKSAKGPAAKGPGMAAKSGSPMLLPPQLRGRSNVVTEDVDRLFTQRAKQAPGGTKGQL